jgi:hypothetical protein
MLFEFIACLVLFASIDALDGGMCCLKPNPTWEKTNVTVVTDDDMQLPAQTPSPVAPASARPLQLNGANFKCNGFQLDFAGAGASNTDLSFAPHGLGQCRIDFPVYDNDRVGSCDPWEEADSRKCWRKTYHIDSTQWSEYDTTELCSQKGSERYIAEWKGGMTTLAKMKFYAFLVQSATTILLRRAVDHPDSYNGPIEVWRLLNTASAVTNIVSLIVVAVLVDLCGEIYPGHPSYYIFAWFKEHDRMAFLGKVRRALTVGRSPCIAGHSPLTAPRSPPSPPPPSTCAAALRHGSGGGAHQQARAEKQRHRKQPGHCTEHRLPADGRVAPL